MSAYIVDPTHIDVLLSVAINGPEGIRPGSWTPPYVSELLKAEGHTGPLIRETANLAGGALLRECVASVAHRYSQPLGELPGPVPNPHPDQYEWTDFGRILTPIEACCAISGFEYQSCEHPGWWESGANHFCQRLRIGLVSCMKGYEGAEWHWTIEKVLSRARRSGNWNALG